MGSSKIAALFKPLKKSEKAFNSIVTGLLDEDNAESLKEFKEHPQAAAYSKQLMKTIAGMEVSLTKIGSRLDEVKKAVYSITG